MKFRCIAIFTVLIFASLAYPRQNSETQSVHKWVQGFYDWYVPLDLKDNSDPGSYLALRKRRSDFSPELVNALNEDLAASKKSKDEVVGLDFDPFLDSQDPDDHYKVGKVTKKGAHYLVEVWGVRSGKQEDAVSVIPEVEQVKGKFRFVNFIMPNAKDDLLHVLKVLKAERAKSTGH